MAKALRALSSGLPPDRRAGLHFPFAGDERFEWFFVPRARHGVPLGDLDAAGLERAHTLLRAGLGDSGYSKVTGIIGLEPVLKELEGGSERRDPRRYYVRIFGEPGGREPWGWSFEGHHVSLNYTLAGGRLAATPSFLGANPAEVRHGEKKGLRVLGREEDLARALVASLDSEQRAAAVVSELAPSDIISFNSRRASPLAPAGLAASRLSGRQLEMLMQLLREYAENMPAPVAEARMASVRAGGAAAVHFAWAGATAPARATTTACRARASWSSTTAPRTTPTTFTACGATSTATSASTSWRSTTGTRTQARNGLPETSRVVAAFSPTEDEADLVTHAGALVGTPPT